MKKILVCYLILEGCGLSCNYFFDGVINIQLNIWLSYIINFSVAILCCFFILKKNIVFKINNIQVKSFLMIIPISICISLLAISVTKLLRFEAIKHDQHLPYYQHLVLSVLVAPIVEELYFRYFLLEKILSTKYFSKNKDIIGVLFIGLLFGLSHWASGLSIMFYTLILGIGYGFIYLYSQNIILSIFAHFLNNLMSFMVLSNIQSTNSINHNNSHNLLFSSIVFLIMTYMVFTFFSIFRKIEWRN